MLKKSIRNKLSVTLLVLSTLIISGCTHAPSATPVSTVQKNFTDDFDMQTLKEAVSKAAAKNNWDIIYPTSQSINLKKSYVIKKRGISPIRSERRYKAEVKNDIYVKVDINKKYFKIEPSEANGRSFKNNCEIKHFNEELAKLENAIYRELVPHLL